MSAVRYKVYDFQTAQDEFNVVKGILEENEALLSNLSTDLEQYSGEAVQKLIAQVDEFASMHSQMLSDMEIAQTEIKEIESIATEKFEPLDADKIMVLHTEKVKAALKGIGSVLDSNLSQSSLSPSSHFIAWSNNRDRELNDGIYEAILNPIDEFKQRKAEEVYRANKEVYEQAYTAYIDDMTFHTEIDYFESVVKDIEGVSRGDFPLITDGTLYESLFEDAVGVTYSDFKQTTIDKYVIDTNGFMPDTILGQLALGGAVGLTLLFGGELIALGSLAVETITTLIGAGYTYLVNASIAATVYGQIKINNIGNAIYNSTVKANIWWNNTALPWMNNTGKELLEKFYDASIENINAGYRRIADSLRNVTYNPTTGEIIGEISFGNNMRGFAQFTYGIGQGAVTSILLEKTFSETLSNITEHKGEVENGTDLLINGLDLILNKLNPLTPGNFILGEIEDWADSKVGSDD